MLADAVHRLHLTGRHDKSGLRPDLRVTYSESSGWQIEVLSQHAYNWAQRHADSFLFDNDGKRIRTNRTGVVRSHRMLEKKCAPYLLPGAVSLPAFC